MKTLEFDDKIWSIRLKPKILLLKSQSRGFLWVERVNDRKLIINDQYSENKTLILFKLHENNPLNMNRTLPSIQEQQVGLLKKKGKQKNPAENFSVFTERSHKNHPSGTQKPKGCH